MFLTFKRFQSLVIHGKPSRRVGYVNKPDLASNISTINIITIVYRITVYYQIPVKHEKVWLCINI